MAGRRPARAARQRRDRARGDDDSADEIVARVCDVHVTRPVKGDAEWGFELRSGTDAVGIAGGSPSGAAAANQRRHRGRALAGSARTQRRKQQRQGQCTHACGCARQGERANTCCGREVLMRHTPLPPTAPNTQLAAANTTKKCAAQRGRRTLWKKVPRRAPPPPRLYLAQEKCGAIDDTDAQRVIFVCGEQSLQNIFNRGLRRIETSARRCVPGSQRSPRIFSNTINFLHLSFYPILL